MKLWLDKLTIVWQNCKILLNGILFSFCYRLQNDTGPNSSYSDLMHEDEKETSNENEEERGEEERGRTQNSGRENGDEPGSREHAHEQPLNVRRGRRQESELGQESSEIKERSFVFEK